MNRRDLTNIITNQLMISFHTKRYVVANYFYEGFEMDICKIDVKQEWLNKKLTSMFRYYEYEIKVDKKDFLTDCEKSYRGKNKFELLEAGELAHKFTYVCPEGLISLSEIPKWAGLQYIPEDFSCIINVRSGKLLRNDFHTDFSQLLDKFYYKYWAVVYRQRKIQHRNEKFKIKNNDK